MNAVRAGLVFLLLCRDCASATTALNGGKTPPNVASTQPAQALFRKGVQALLARDFAAAERNFLASAKADPKFPDPLLGLADVAVKQQKRAVALQWLNKALAIAPNSDEVYLALARFQRGDNDLPRAERSFRKALSLNQQDFPALLELGGLYMQMLRPAKAEPLFRSAVKLRPADASAHYGLGVALTTIRKTPEAIDELTQAIRLAPNDVAAPRALARLHSEGRQYKDALAVLERAMRVAPNEPALALDHADIAAASGDTSRAEREYRALLNGGALQRGANRDSLLAVAHVRIGELRVQANDSNAAATEFAAALETQPDNVAALNNLAWLDATAQRDLDGALAHARRAVELAPSLADVRDTLGWVHRARGELAAAGLEFERAAHIDPAAAAPVYHLGIVLSEQNKPTAARAALARALVMTPPLSTADAADAKRRLAAMAGR